MIMLWLNKYAIEDLGTQFKYGMNNLLAYLSTYFNSFKLWIHLWKQNPILRIWQQ